MISRRQILAMAAAAPVFSALKLSAEVQESAPSVQPSTAAKSFSRMGGTPTAFMLRSMASRGSATPFDIVEHCHNLNLAGVQTNPPSNDPEAIKAFRKRLESYPMHLICDPRFPQQESDVAAFETQIKAFKEAGAVACHAALTGRRYEDFNSLEPFRKMFEQCQRSIELAEPVLRKYKMKLGIENHKGWRSAEQVAWLKRLGSEWVGICFDFGNNISLCEDPADTFRTLAPHTFFAHIKDMAVEEYADGFLLSEVPLGQGILDLKPMVQTLRKTDPGMIFDLEMITRDPLKIPVFTSKYWATFDDDTSPLPGRDLAKVLDLVRKNRPKVPLPRMKGLSQEAQVKAEDEYNAQCIAYARQSLDL
jgi:sugar phosphate isomerase/epimerase